ncbi:MAG: hypothetical protein J3K34DRAFT_456218 [Monoraphidium minutum]|nr:MAG: hypothetical protein J3K34DRAFT_456218 [Monoraphidium minutum]
MAAAAEARQKRFGNGDSYVGSWKNGTPSGEGKYVWADGSVYTGGWKGGAKHGVGTYTWPSGASYHGEWAVGFMHGVGSFEAPDGSRYSGGWRKDVKHGLGKKIYANGDSYEGLWDSGRPHGPGRYIWADGNEYDGEWRAGKMHGQGTFVWSTGERYDGGWKEGREDGLGLFAFPDGATYRGFWEAGKKHGVGVLRPPPPGPSQGGGAGAPQEPGSRAGSAAAPAGAARAEGSAGGGGGGGGAVAPGQHSPRGGSEAGEAVAGGGDGGGGGAAAAPPSAGGAPGALHGAAAPASLPQGTVLVKEYDHGRLVRQSLLHASEALAVLGRPDRVRRNLNAGLRHSRKMTRLGQVVYKDNSSYDLMVGLQAGIRWSATRALPQADSLPAGAAAACGPRPLAGAAFADKLIAQFPRAGSVDTPVHRASSDFEWRDYCPGVFRNLRDVFGWGPAALVQELCSDHALRLLNSPGKSGSVFFLSSDDRLLVKTIRKAEFDLLARLLPAYYAHMLAHPNSLLVRVLGLFSITAASSGGRKVRFVVMANLFSTGLQIHERYDLKGSTLGRTAGKEAAERARQCDPCVVLKDLDLGGRSFKLEAQWHERLMEQIAADCALLESCGVMDYSMLLGIHDRARGFVAPPGAAAHSRHANGGGGGVNGGAGRAPRPSAASGVTVDDEGGGGSDEPWSGDEGGGFSGGGGGATGAGGGAAAGQAVNFEEHKADDEAGLQRRMARVEARVQDLGLGPEAAAGLVALARAELLSSGPRHGHARAGRRRGGAPAPAARWARSDTLRLLPLSDGGSDALALSLGRSRVQLGAAMAATALPPGGGGDINNGGGGDANNGGGGARDVVLFFGIIDIFTVYNSTKRLERVLKAAAAAGRGGAAAISAAPPRAYAARFQELMRRVFL